jgi:Fungal Zn(2)-Cys(6) binuclear cluster domain
MKALNGCRSECVRKSEFMSGCLFRRKSLTPSATSDLPPDALVPQASLFIFALPFLGPDDLSSSNTAISTGMLTQTPPLRRSRSPEDFHSSERKRRRKALSCYDCRRRKLKCDREYPSCSRCRKAGQAHSCIYESGSVEAQDYGDGEKLGVGGTLPVVAFETGARGAILLPRPSAQPSIEPNTTPGKPFSDASSSKLVLQARKIAQLESRLASLEASQPAATWQSFGEVESVAKSSEKRNIIRNGPFLTSPRGPTQSETILFRGKNYKTQYYGGTNPTSLVAHVRTQFLF